MILEALNFDFLLEWGRNPGREILAQVLIYSLTPLGSVLGTPEMGTSLGDAAGSPLDDYTGVQLVTSIVESVQEMNDNASDPDIDRRVAVDPFDVELDTDIKQGSISIQFYYTELLSLKRKFIPAVG
jgi:hypothetical protein